MLFWLINYFSMLHYFLFADSKPFFINIRENVNIDFAPIFLLS